MKPAFISHTSPQADFLVSALKERGINAIKEFRESYKIIDIYIPEVKLEIEVDGNHHYEDANSAYIDLLKTKRTFQEGRRLIRIPNILLKKENSYKTIEELIVIIEMLIRYQKKFRWAPSHITPSITM